jgi:hypothetical protein
MNRLGLALFSLLVLALVSLPAAARTSALSTGPNCPDTELADNNPAEAAEAPKPAAKRSAPANKPDKPATGRAGTQSRTVRWHRFLPGMYR